MRYTFLLAALLFLLPQSADRQAISAFSKSMESAPADQRLAYNALQVAFATFREAHLRHETCRAAAGCAALQADELARLNHDFLVMAHGFTPAAPPSFTADDRAASDDALNAAYQKAFDPLPPACPETGECISQPTLRDVERDWIRYRDAWATFGPLRWPQIASDSWLTYLTRQRTEQIRRAFGR